MYGYRSDTKVVVVFVGLLLIAAFVAGWILSDSRWDNTQARQEQAQRESLWRDRWNKLWMVLVAATIGGTLFIAGIRIVAPFAAQAHERRDWTRVQLVEQQIKLEEKRAQVLREERRLKEVCLQQSRVTLAQEQGGGNGREREPLFEQPVTTPSQYTNISSTESRN